MSPMSPRPTNTGPKRAPMPDLSRRTFLAGAGLGLAGAATLAVTNLGTRLALAAPGSPQTGDTLVVVFLRGGADGLSISPPYGYPSYRKLRPTIAIAPPGEPNGALPLDGSNPNAVFPTGLAGVVGLHPAFKPIHDTLWRDGKLAVLPATGLPPSESASRSHFSATRYVQAGSASAAVGGGWLARMINTMGASAPGGVIPAVDTSARSDLLRGGRGAAVIPNLASFGVNGFPDRDRTTAALRALHAASDSIAGQGRTALDTAARVGSISTELRPGYPTGALAKTFSELSSMLEAGLGIQAAVIDYGGWDQHSNLGTVGAGRFHDRATELAAALRAFSDDTNGLEEITVLVMTEFGRTINENGSRAPITGGAPPTWPWGRASGAASSATTSPTRSPMSPPTATWLCSPITASRSPRSSPTGPGWRTWASCSPPTGPRGRPSG